MACWKQKVYLPVRSYISFSFRPSIRLALRTNVTYLPILYVQGAQSALVVSAPESLQKKCPYIAKMIDDRRICLLVVDTFTFNFFHDDGCSAGMRDCALNK